MTDKNSVTMFRKARNMSKLPMAWKNWSNKKYDVIKIRALMISINKNFMVRTTYDELQSSTKIINYKITKYI
jgi:hypothetical protein